MNTIETKKQKGQILIIAAIFTIIGVVLSIIVFITNISISEKKVNIEWYRKDITFTENTDETEKGWKIRIIADNNGNSESFEKEQILIFKLEDNAKIIRYYIINNETEGYLTQSQNSFKYTFNKWKHREKFEFEILINCNKSVEPTIILNAHHADIKINFANSPSTPNAYLPKFFKRILEWDTIVKWFSLIISAILILSALSVLVFNFVRSCKYYNWHIKHNRTNNYHRTLNKTSLHILPETIYNAHREKEIKDKDYPELLSIGMMISVIIIMLYAVVSFLCLYHYLDL